MASTGCGALQGRPTARPVLQPPNLPEDPDAECDSSPSPGLQAVRVSFATQPENQAAALGALKSSPDFQKQRGQQPSPRADPEAPPPAASPRLGAVSVAWMKRLEESQEIQMMLLEDILKGLAKVHQASYKPSLTGAGFEPVGLRSRLSTSSSSNHPLLARMRQPRSSLTMGRPPTSRPGAPPESRPQNMPVSARTWDAVLDEDTTCTFEESIQVLSPELVTSEQSGVLDGSCEQGGVLERSMSPDWYTDDRSAKVIKEEASSPAEQNVIGSWVNSKARRSKSMRTSRIWRTLNDRNSSVAAKVWSQLMVLLIMGGVASSWWEVVRPQSFAAPSMTVGLQAVFGTELALRFATCPTQRLFFLKVYNLFDLAGLLCVIPTILVITARYASEGVSLVDSLFYIRIFVPVLMLLKLLRRFRAFNLLMSAFAVAFEAMPVIIYTLCLIVVSFAAFLFLSEPRTSIATLSDALWYVVIAMTTVGYHEAVTPTGRLISSALFVIGVLYLAIPIGIVGSAFNNVWQDRERLFMLQEIREQISSSGFTQDDIREMFEALDVNGDGFIDWDEFKELLPNMEIFIADNVAFSVFQTFDDDGEGTIDFNEFLCGVYPTERFLAKWSFKKQSTETDMGNCA